MPTPVLKSLKDNTVPENIIQKSTDWMTLSFIINLRFLTINLGTFFGDISILVQTTVGQSCPISAFHADFDKILLFLMPPSTKYTIILENRPEVEFLSYWGSAPSKN